MPEFTLVGYYRFNTFACRSGLGRRDSRFSGGTPARLSHQQVIFDFGRFLIVGVLLGGRCMTWRLCRGKNQPLKHELDLR